MLMPISLNSELTLSLMKSLVCWVKLSSVTIFAGVVISIQNFSLFCSVGIKLIFSVGSVIQLHMSFLGLPLGTKQTNLISWTLFVFTLCKSRQYSLLSLGLMLNCFVSSAFRLLITILNV